MGYCCRTRVSTLPWKTSDPPSDVAQKYNLEKDYASNLHYDWLKSHDEKINKLEENMIAAYDQIHKLHVELGTHK